MAHKLRYASVKRIELAFLSGCMAAFVLFFFVPQIASAQQNTEQMASYYYQNQEYDKAIELYEELYGRTSNKFYYEMLLQSYVSLERYIEAENLVQKRLKQRPKELECYVVLGVLQKRQGQKRRYLRTFDEALEQLGFDGRQVVDLATAFDKAGYSGWAIKVYLFAREKSKNALQYVMELAALYEKSGQYEAMMQEYFNLLDKMPNSMSNIQLSLQRALSETSNPQLAQGLRQALSSRVREHPDNGNYIEMMIWFSLQQQDFRFALTQAKAVDVRFADDKGEQVFRVAQIAQNNGDFATATEGYRYLIKKGKEHHLYFDSRVKELGVRFDRLDKQYALGKGELSALLQEYDKALVELGKNVKTILLMRNYAHLLAYYADDMQAASDLLYDIIEMPKVPKRMLNETKLELGDLLLFAGEQWDASLLYSQVEKANKEDVLGSTAKFRNAKLSYYLHEFRWAKMQLDVLRASTSKLIANDAMQLSLLISDNMEADSTFGMLERYAEADLLLYRNQLEAAWQAYDTITMLSFSHSLFDEILLQKARIRMKQGRYEEADSLLVRLVTLYGEDILADDAVMMLAELNDKQLHNLDRARSFYEKLILEYPTSLYINSARKRYQELKSNETKSSL